MEKHPPEELQELTHEAWPGYRKVFIIAIVVAALYLMIIFLGVPLDKIEVPHHDDVEAPHH
jgi:hypothetical protein